VRNTITFDLAKPNTMKIEIWSDIMCPFCYIGKRRFDLALQQFEHKDKIDIEWKSFLLSPDMVTDPTLNMHQFLAKHKGIPVEEAKGMNDYVTNMAAQTGLIYNFDKAIPANSFNAHRFLHFAKHYGKQDEAEEKLFSAYFTKGKNIDDAQTLIEIATELHLDVTALAGAMTGDSYVQEVLNDVEEAQQLGVRGVPFFYLTGSMPYLARRRVMYFLTRLQKHLPKWQQENKPAPFDVTEGDSCTPGGGC
jgi:predicted DsbA family dithiol-disulfide isomerase